MSGIRSESELRAYLLDLDRRLESVDIAYEEGRWLKNIGQLPRAEQNALEARRSALLLDDQSLAIVQKWRDRTTDPTLARMCLVLDRLLVGARVEALPAVYEVRTRIEQKVIAFRPAVRSRTLDRADVRQILRAEPDRALRREAWLAYTSIAAEVETDVLELVRRRNAEAAKLGFETYAQQGLALQGLDQPGLQATFESLTKETETLQREFLSQAADRLGLDAAKPWDLDYALGQLSQLPDEAFPAADIVSGARALASGIGLEEAAAGVRVDLLDIPWGGICVTVRAPDDVRILMKPLSGHRHYETMFHEFGHALHARSIQQPIHVFGEVTEPGPFCEGMAASLARFTVDPDWLASRLGLDESMVAGARLSWRQEMLVHLRLLIAKALFEYQMYANPEQDLAALWRETLSEVTCVVYDEAVGWADNLYWTSYPTYIQNYVIAEMIASQTHAALRARYRRLLGEPGVGAWLCEHYWASANAVEWTERIERATGEPLSARVLIHDLVASFA